MVSRNPVQQLYGLCEAISASDEQVRKLEKELEGKSSPSLLTAVKSAVQALSLEDLGVTPRSLPSYFQPNLITQVKLFSSDRLWIGLFCMNAGLGFPLHDHPSMTAFTYLLRGCIQVVSFDRIQQVFPGLVKGKLAQNATVNAPAVLSLSHDKGNLHEILALEPTIFLDIFMPFYNDARPCTYYRMMGQLEDEFYLMRCPDPSLPNITMRYAGLPLTS